MDAKNSLIFVTFKNKFGLLYSILAKMLNCILVHTNSRKLIYNLAFSYIQCVFISNIYSAAQKKCYEYCFMKQK